MAKGILIAAMDFSNVPADEFNDWYGQRAHTRAATGSGFLTLQRWIGAENPKQSVATYDLDTLAVLQSPEYRAIGGENLSPWSKRVTARWSGCSATRANKSSQAMRRRQRRWRAPVGRHDARPGGRDRFQRMVRHRTPAGPFPRPRRPMRAPVRTSTANPKYVALYHLASPVWSTRRMEAGERLSTPACRKRVRDPITNRLRLVCRNYVRRSPIFREHREAEPGSLVPRLGPLRVTRLSELPSC